MVRFVEVVRMLWVVWVVEVLRVVDVVMVDEVIKVVGAFWPFLFSSKTCAGNTNASHPSIHVSNHQYQFNLRNCTRKLVAAILMHIMTKKGKK